MGVPYSKYSKYYRKGYNVFTATKETIEKMTDNFNEDRYYFKSHQPGDEELILGLPANSLLLLPNQTKESNVELGPRGIMDSSMTQPTDEKKEIFNV